MYRFEFVSGINLSIGMLIAFGAIGPLLAVREYLRHPKQKTHWVWGAVVLGLYILGVPVAIVLIALERHADLLVMASLYVILANAVFFACLSVIWSLASELSGVKSAANGRRKMLVHYQENLEELIRRRTSQLRAEVQRRTLAEKEAQQRFVLLDSELQQAAEVQASILHDPVERSWLECAVFHQPYARVSGDWYAFREGSNGGINLAVADASGHSAASAYLTVMADITLSGLPPELTPAWVCETLNERLAEYSTPLYLTAAIGSLSPDGKLELCHAGHPLALVLGANGEVRKPFSGGGSPIGMFAEPPVPYPQESTQLSVGDTVLIYTDGVLEQLNPSGERFNEPRLDEELRHSGARDAASLISHLTKALENFRADEALGDDLTLMAIRYLGPA